MSTVCCFLAEGFEEVEALSVVDILRRGGIETKLVSVSDKLEVVSSHKVCIESDAIIKDIDFDKVDAIFLPGGVPGTTNLKACKMLCDRILEFNKNKKLLAAVCAAPSIYGELGILKDKKATCYPGWEDKLLEAKYVSDRVVTDDNITTSRGLGTSLELGLKLLEILKDKETADDMARKVQLICE